jgi:NAD(P)-dependent dehydrogenase (short-subunit alcohol dehydrogenase family)
MQELSGKAAVVTGAASGIGFALAERFAAEGMRLVLADIEAPALESAHARLTAAGATALAVVTDVSVPEDVEALADKAYEAFGAVHVLCNNAGVAGEGAVPAAGIWARTVEDWQWILGVNLWGVVHGVHSFVSRMVASGEEGYVVNTASLAGVMPANNIYGVSKHAVVGLSEALFTQLKAARAPIGVSVLCPGFVATNILDSARNRPARWAAPTAARAAPNERSRQMISGGLDPAQVAAAVLDGIRNERFYILAMQPEWSDRVAARLHERADDIIAGRGPQPPRST